MLNHMLLQYWVTQCVVFFIVTTEHLNMSTALTEAQRGQAKAVFDEYVAAMIIANEVTPLVVYYTDTDSLPVTPRMAKRGAAATKIQGLYRAHMQRRIKAAATIQKWWCDGFYWNPRHRVGQRAFERRMAADSVVYDDNEAEA